MVRLLIGLSLAAVLAAVQMHPASAQQPTSETYDITSYPFVAFEALNADSDSEVAWSSVFEARKYFDGAAHEEYAYAAYALFMEQPELLHRRFLNGDARAIVLLQDVFVPGTWTLGNPDGGDGAETERILNRLQSFVSSLESLRPARHEYDRRAMHDAFVGRAHELLAEWPEKRRELLSKR